MISAKDGGAKEQDRKEAICQLQLKVTDVNDSYPNLNKTARRIRIASSLKKGNICC
jgi:hypothetical protein